MRSVMPYASELETESLVDLIRNPPCVSPEDSLQRFLDVIAYTPYAMLPVVADGGIAGYMHQSDVLYLLGIDDGPERRAASYSPVSLHMQPAAATIDPSDTRRDACRMCSAAGLEMIAVADSSLRYQGVVLSRDLLIGGRPQIRLNLPTIGGMATPFGVYLSDGTNQAGAGNLALAAGGAALAILATTAMVLVQIMVDLAGHITHHDVSAISVQDNPVDGKPLSCLLAVGLRLTVSFVFLSLIRISRIAGFHAAEHQTVHAIEHGEPLVPEIVSRMPRPHPRCGTNLLAAGILFWNLSALFRAIPGCDADSSAVFAVIATLFTWRRFGTFLQAAFTTRPARTRELNSGIAAATSLISMYRLAPPRRPKFMRRLWCSGLPQSMAGMLPTMTLLTYLLSAWLR